MMPREKGGVVDSNYKVYGTQNIRVVDLSVLSLQTAVHPQGMGDLLPSCALLTC